jgi:hypothetical protein
MTPEHSRKSMGGRVDTWRWFLQERELMALLHGMAWGHMTFFQSKRDRWRFLTDRDRFDLTDKIENEKILKEGERQKENALDIQTLVDAKMIDKRQACITTHFLVASRMGIRVLLPNLISSKRKVVFFPFSK